MLKRLATLCCVTVWTLVGCAVIDPAKMPEHDVHLFGYVRLTGTSSRVPAYANPQANASERAERRDIRVLGAWWNDGAGLGYKRSVQISMPPGCDVLFLVPDEATVERILPLLESSNLGESLCASTQ